MHTIQQRASVLVAALGIAGLAACGDPPGTTPIAANTTEVSKSVEASSMPLPGQPNDHSNLASTPSQRAETADVNASPAKAATANSDKPSERGQQQ